MKRIIIWRVLAVGLIALSGSPLRSGDSTAPAHAGYLGFDRNDYPGDESLKALRRTFSFSGYWLNNAPGTISNSWIGKRKVLQAAGFGFLVVFNGRTDAQIKLAGDATKLGRSDGAFAVSSARREGFPPGTIIFLDQEEGGRLLPGQRAYLHAWVDAATSASFRHTNDGGALIEDHVGQNPRSAHERHQDEIKRAKNHAQAPKADHTYTGKSRSERNADRISANQLGVANLAKDGSESAPKPTTDGVLGIGDPLTRNSAKK